jgi:glutamate-1-semialdehyde 2,1-aminomutase
LTSDRTRVLHTRAQLIPGGGHTYSKGDDQFPANAPKLIERGEGAICWDTDGERWLDYGMGLRSVILGHAYPPVLDAVREELLKGSNFTRPAPIEGELAELLASIVPCGEMSKFAKNGSDVTSAATRLARAHTGRPLIAACKDNPFYSFDDWWIGVTPNNSGIPDNFSAMTLTFQYNNIASLEALFAAHPDQIACVIIEPVALERPRDNFLQKVVDVAHKNGAVAIFDEMISGFRYHVKGAQGLYGATPDLATYGKALANGFSVSALCGSRDIMRLGGIDHDKPRVFLLSATHGAETHSLRAAIKAIQIMRDQDVATHIERLGARLMAGLRAEAKDAGLEGVVECIGYESSPVIICRDRTGAVSMPLRTLFLQEMCAQKILIPYIAISFSHTDAHIDETVAAARKAFAVYAQALEKGVDGLLQGPAVKPVFRRFC